MSRTKIILFGLIVCIAMGVYVLCSFTFPDRKMESPIKIAHPKIVNIVNFIRLDEPRDPEITKKVLFETVVNQVAMMRKYKLKGTFLLQYDALLDPGYQKLLKALPADSFEIGAWWEIPEPLVEDAGIKWRGKTSWDPYSSADFSIGYSPDERKKLADTYMRKFKEIFGYYPRSVGSWFIDAYTLSYLYKKYGIVASCNCKDQIGTDGYTLWGGYWNQAYYPSKKNAYMPAQDPKNQIPVPVFRMLGSDPVRQYDNGIGANRQGVVTLEPVYQFGGGDSAWVHWYFRQFIKGESLAFAYVQAGQENSFTWKRMEKGFKIQMPLIAGLRNQGKIKVETLAETGKWFRKNFKVTPSTSVVASDDSDGSDLKTVWFDSRFYRMNLLWRNGTLRFRDIHLFNENMVSAYLYQKSTSGKYSFFTLPFVDGNRWSAKDKIAGLWFKTLINGKEILMKGSGNSQITSNVKGKLHISWPVEPVEDTLVMDISERQINIKMNGSHSINWFLDLSAAPSAGLPFRRISSGAINSRFEGINYSIGAKSGSFTQPGGDVILRALPENNSLVLDFSNNSGK